MRQCFDDIGSIRPESIWGVLSLIAWSLFIVVTLKYVIVIMRADNRGEGGILALTALALRAANRGTRAAGWIIAAGMIGAALFYGDGVITPAISVLSAVEGLKVATPVFEPYILPITVVLLVALFMFQRRGTGMVGEFFGPIMALWFVVLACLGGAEIARHPACCSRSTRRYGINFLLADPGTRLYSAWRGGAGGDRRRGALCRYGPFRRPADPTRLAVFRVSRRCCSIISARARCCCTSRGR